MAVKILNGIDVDGSMNIVASDVPNLDASKITSGTFSTDRIPNLSGVYQPAGDYLTLETAETTFQPIGNYLTSVPSEYLTQTEGDARYLKLTGGTLTGTLTLSAVNPRIDFNGTSDSGVDMAIVATPEGLNFIEPEQQDKVHFQILDDTGVNSPFGYQWNGQSLDSRYASASHNHNTLYDAIGSAAAVEQALNTRIEQEVLPAIQTPAITSNGSTPSLNSGISASEIRSLIGTQVAGNYFTDGDTVLNMANNDGLVYDDSTNRMYVKLDGTNREIYHTGNFTDSSANWNTAYGWGNHASAGYLTSIPSSYATDVEVNNAVQAVNERIDTEVFDAIATVDGNIPTNNNQLTNGAGYITSANGGNAATLDGIDSTQFLRSDAEDTKSGNTIFTGPLWVDNTNRIGTSKYTWTGSAITTTSIEIVDDNSNNESVGATLVIHNYGDGGVKFRMGNYGDKTLYLSSGQGNGAGNVTDDNSGTYFNALKINGNTVWHSGNLSLSTLGYTGATNANYITNNNQLTNGAGYATQSYVTTQINNVIDSAPGALNTLNELAAALGDDSNFSTTVANNIGAVNERIDAEVLPAIDAKQNAGNYASFSYITLNDSATTASFIAELTTEHGAFQDNYRAYKVGWSYAGNSNLDVGFESVELAGCLIECFGGTYKHVRLTRPTTGTGGRSIYVYNDQGSSYAPGWRQIWTSDEFSSANVSNWNTAYGWGNHASAGYLTSIPSTYATDTEVNTAVDVVNNRIETEVLPAISSITLASLGYTGATNANYITNNNQLTNGAGYITNSVTDFYVADQILHTGDTNTYMQFHAADQWRVVTGGSERLEVNNSQVKVQGAFQVNGNILLTGSATTTNQGRMIDFTGFDKEGTIDFSDRAYIQHTENTGGHSGSVLVISSQNDSNDGIAFLTNASSKLKHNSNNIATETWVSAQGYLTSIPSSYATDAELASLDTALNARIEQEILPAIPTNNNQLTNGAGYTTNTGTITGVSTGTGLDGTATSGAVSITLDLSELTDMTATVSPTVDELILLDNGAERRKRFSEIFGSAAYQASSAFDSAGSADAVNVRIDNEVLPIIPTDTSHLTNGAGYITSADGGDADLLDGLDLGGTRANVANKVVRTDGNGYTNFGWINTTSGRTTSTLTDIYVNTNDGYIRKATPAHFRSQITDGSYDSIGSADAVNARIDGEVLPIIPFDNSQLTNGAGYITGYTETSTLDSVADRGRTTNQQLISTNPSGFRVDSGSSARIEIDSNNNWSYLKLMDNGATCWDIATFNNGSLEWRPNGGDANRMTLSKTGNLSVSGTIVASDDITAFSDARIKENVETLPNALESVKQMRGVTYNKIGEEKQSVGVIAQELEEVVPQLVHTDEEGMKSVAYGNLTAVLIEALKEQQAQIEELKARLDGLTK